MAGRTRWAARVRRRFLAGVMPGRRSPRAPEVFPWAGVASLVGASCGVHLVNEYWGGADPGPMASLARMILGAVAGGLTAWFAAANLAVEPPHVAVSLPGRDRLPLFDPWLDAQAPDPEPLLELPVVGPEPEPRPRPEPEAEPITVRPRVRGELSGEALPVEGEVSTYLRSAGEGAVWISGPEGSGKTLALRHLERVLPPQAGVALLDDPPPGAVGVAVASNRGLVVYASRRPAAEARVLATLPLAPWGDDELIEHLLHEGNSVCASVMTRLRRDSGREMLGGNPELWRVVLERMIAEESVVSVRHALRAELAGRLGDKSECRSVSGRCLEALAVYPDGDPVGVVAGLAPDAARLVRHRAVRVLLASEELVRRLAQGEPLAVLDSRLPADLVIRAGTLVEAEPAALERLKWVVGHEFCVRQSMAASLLHAARFEWVPTSPPVLNLIGAYLAGVSWREAQLSGCFMHEVDLTGADLTGADLSKASFPGGMLARTRLRGANLDQAGGHSADLSWADLRDARLTQARLGSASLEGADLRGTGLVLAYLGMASLQNARLRGAQLSGATLYKAKIDGADFTEARLERARLDGLKLSIAEFTGASFRHAEMKRCDLECMELPGVDFSNADLRGALLTGTKLTGANLGGASLVGAGLADVEWEGVNLRGADLTEASFHAGTSRNGLVGSPVACEGSRTGFYTDDSYEQDYKTPEEIRKADLRGADLRGASIRGTDFYLVDLRGAKFDPEQAAHLRQSGAILESRC